MFAGGESEARFDKELSLQEKFFHIQEEGLKKFQLSLESTNLVFNGIKWINATGYTEFTIYINDPPENGTCSIATQNDAGNWVDTNAGDALIQEFRLECDGDWVDPNQHKIIKFNFKSKLLFM